MNIAFMIHKKEQNLTNPLMICDKCKFVIPLGAMYWMSDLGRTFCSDCHREIEEDFYKRTWVRTFIS